MFKNKKDFLLSRDFNGPGTASWVEISKSALENNIDCFKKTAQGRFSLGVVLKGNAYGHGLLTVFRVIRDRVDCVYLISPQDAILLQEDSSFSNGGFSPRIIVIGGLTPEEISVCAQKNIEMALGDRVWEEAVPLLRKRGLKAKVHIHLDTGLSREGYFHENLKQDLKFLKTASDVISVVAVMSHFANVEDVTAQDYAISQIKAFKKGVTCLKEFLLLPEPLDEHFSGSAAALLLPEARLNGIRVGISLYGFWPSAETRISAKFNFDELPHLEPVLSWKCKSQVVKKLKPGTYVGYGCAYRCDRETRIAIFPVGYYDGYSRSVSGKAHVLIQGRRCSVIGRVMMNHIIVDITQVSHDNRPVEATLIGKSGDEVVSAQMLADWADTIQYEVVTRLGSHLERVVVP